MNGENMDDEITYEDVMEYEKLFVMAPSFLLERFAKRNKLDIILKTPTSELQEIMNEAYIKTNIKQYKILANPKYEDFIENNLDEIRKLI